MAIWKELKAKSFLLDELIKRDFKKKYKRSVLGIFWSVLSPVLTMLVMRLMFTQFFGRDIPHYTTYILAGNIVFSYFRDSTSEGMNAIVGNARILSKIDLPKTLFLFSKSVAFLMNFAIGVLVFLVFCAFDGVSFGWHFFSLLVPMALLFVFNLGVALFLSTFYVFMKDVRYLWSVFLRLLMYMSAVFYRIDGYPEQIKRLFWLNPVYVYITYFRQVALEGRVPSAGLHGLAVLYALLALGIGLWVFKKQEDKFVFYF